MRVCVVCFVIRFMVPVMFFCKFKKLPLLLLPLPPLLTVSDSRYMIIIRLLAKIGILFSIYSIWMYKLNLNTIVWNSRILNSKYYYIINFSWLGQITPLKKVSYFKQRPKL